MGLLMVSWDRYSLEVEGGPPEPLGPDSPSCGQELASWEVTQTALVRPCLSSRVEWSSPGPRRQAQGQLGVGDAQGFHGVA